MQSVLVLALALSPVDSTEPLQRPVFLNFSAPGECPSRDAFQQALIARTDRVRFTDEKTEATATASVAVTKKGRRFEGHLLVETQDGARTRRTLEGLRCDSLVRAMSLLAALVLDPEGARTGPLGDPPAPVVESVPPEPTPEPGAALEPSAAVAPRSLPPPVVTVREYELELLVAALASSSVSGLLDGGAGGRVNLVLGRSDQLLRFCASLGAGLLAGRVVSAEVGRAHYPARFLAELDAGAGLSWGTLRVHLGAFVQLAPVWVEGLDGDRLLASQRWLWAVGPRGGLAWNLGGWVFAVRAGVGFGLRLETYVVSPRGPVFSVPLASFSGALELGHQLPW